MTRLTSPRPLLVVAAVIVAFGTMPSRLAAQQPEKLSPQVVAQMSALTAEKQARTPAQRKMDSQLVYAAKRARGERMAPNISAMRVTFSDVNARGVVVDVRADVTDALLDRLRTLGADVINASATYRHIRVRAALTQIEAIAALPEVAFVQPKQEAAMSLRRTVGDEMVTSVGGRNSEGDVTHRADVARATFGVSGAGVRVGVISDGVNGLATSQASGDLGPVTVIDGTCTPGLDSPDCAEGTAMLEIVHDLAPNASLYFATAIGGPAVFAQNIAKLQAAGCTIIVDDIGYFVESPFQDGQVGTSPTNGGVIAQAVKNAAAAGVLYFSAAANSGNKHNNTSGTWEGDFLDGGDATGPLTGAGRLHSFGGQTFDQFLVNDARGAVALFWSDPLGASANDYDLFILNSDGTAVVAFSNNSQSGTQDPIELVGGSLAGERAVIVKFSGSPRFLHLDSGRNRLQLSTQGSTHGHAATSAPNSFGVAATPAQNPGPYPGAFTASNNVEPFSSDGPRRIFFAADGTPLTPGDVSSTGGVVLQKPDFTAADGVSVTGAGGFSSPFFGTSAAAPHAAAIAALVKSRNLHQTATQVREALVSSAIDIEAPGIDPDSGYGILMADVAVAHASASPAAARPGDFDGDRVTDVAAFRASTGQWWMHYSGGEGTNPVNWGGSGDVPVPADYDGDGIIDVAVFRPSTGRWWIRYSSGTGPNPIVWGGSGDTPMPADYDGDGIADVAVFRASTGQWWIRYSAGAGTNPIVWGSTGDTPVPADYDRDGVTDVAVFRPSTGQWWIRYSSGTGTNPINWGGSGDTPVPADYDGDGIIDVAVFRPSTGQWWIWYSGGTGPNSIVWGGSGDTPVPADYDGDGITDVAVFRPSTGQWWIRYSSGTGTNPVIWGGPGDIPL